MRNPMTSEDTNHLILITLPHSHYAEKARWALDWLALPYREEPHIPLLHWFATVPRGGRTVPVLVDGAQRFTDSTAILVHADALCGGDLLYPADAVERAAVETLEEEFDQVLGPHTRRWAYAHLLAEKGLLRQMMARGVPRRETRLLPLILPLVIPAVRASLGINTESTRRSMQRIDSTFENVAARLRDGRRFLVAERFTAADLTFAALAAPVLLPAECRAGYPEPGAVPLAMCEEILRLRDTVAGQFALRLFTEERRAVRRSHE